VNAWYYAAVQRYEAIVLGVAIGTAAKYGMTLSEGRSVTWRGVLADILLMGFVALMALVATDRLGLTGNSATLCAALFAISSDRVVRLVRERFMRRVEASMEADIEHKKGELRQAVQTQLSADRVIKDIGGGEE
jgi:NhaP-type Na+/H+ or K+/H+ antiporter